MSPIPAEIVIGALLLWFAFRGVRSWAQIRALQAENKRLTAELSEARGTIAALVDKTM